MYEMRIMRIAMACVLGTLAIGLTGCVQPGPGHPPIVSLTGMQTPGWVLPDPTAVRTSATQQYTYGTQVAIFGSFWRIPVTVNGGTPTDALTSQPAWAAGSYYAAPDVRRVGNQYLMYFTATPAGSWPNTNNCIGVATSTDAVHFTPESSALICGEVWDPNLEFVGGQPVLMYSQAFGSSRLIMSIRLTPNGRGTSGGSSLLLNGGTTTVENATAIWESNTNQWLMLYSSGDWTGAGYTTRIAYCPAALNAGCTPTSGGSLPISSATIGSESLTGIGGMDVFPGTDGSLHTVFHYWQRGGNAGNGAYRRTGQSDVLVLGRE